MRAVGARGIHVSLFKSKPGCCNSGFVAGEELELAKWGALCGVLREERGLISVLAALGFNFYGCSSFGIFALRLFDSDELTVSLSSSRRVSSPYG